MQSPGLQIVLALTLVAGAAGTARATQPDVEVPAVLDLMVNTAPKGEIRVLLAAGEVWADADALRTAGLVPIGGIRKAVGDRVFVRLSSIDPPLRVEVDEAALILSLTADASLFGATLVRLGTNRPEGIQYRRAPSAFVNYGATWASAGGQALNLESGISMGRSLWTSSLFLSSSGRPTRGLTAAIVDDTARLARYQFGDAIVATGPLGGSLQLAGVTVSRDFSLDPYFVRYPTTGLSGVVTTPSRVEVYVNDQLVRSLHLPPGAYQLANLALPSGAADARVIVRDAFGGQQEFGGSYYVTTSVLARGLQQFQYAVGAARERQFDTLWAYGGPVITGTHRIGLTDTVTLGGRLELESGLVSAGPAVTMRLGRFGAVELSGGASQRRGRRGAAGSLAYEYVTRSAGVSLAWREASDSYQNLTSRRMLLATRREVMASTTARLAARVALSVGWQAQEAAGQAGSIRRASVSSSISLTRRVSVFVSATRSRFERVWSTGAFAALHVNAGPRTMASASLESGADQSRATITAQRSAPVGPGLGYRMQAGGLGSESTLVDGELRAQTTWAQADLRQSLAGGARLTWAQINGALVAIGGRVMATRPVQDGFALIRVPDVRGVRAYVSHQEMGRTDRHGDLLVPNLLPYYGNRISIADGDVPPDRTLSYKQLLLATPYRGGAIAEFPATREWRVAGSLSLAGDPGALRGQRALDARLLVQTPRGAIDSWLGADGEFYLEGLAPGTHVVHVVTGTLACTATLVVPVSDAPVAHVGEVPCVPAPEGPGR